MPAPSEALEIPSDADLFFATGRIDAKSSPLFERLPKAHSNKETFVHRDTYADLMAMIQAARKDGILLEVVSGHRSFSHQQSIWERKWKALEGSDAQKVKEIMQFSSFPGISRHHWGSDMDFNSVNLNYWQETAEGKRTYAWLQQNASRFNFCEPYSGNRVGGYANEPWHWSHLPVARGMRAIQIHYLAEIKQQKIAGSGTVAALPHLRAYIDDIAPHCK